MMDDVEIVDNVDNAGIFKYYTTLRKKLQCYKGLNSYQSRA